MLRPIYNYVKKIVPRLSETELLALRSGTVYTDRGIFDGTVVLPDPISKDKLPSYHTQNNSFETYSKLNNKVDDLLSKYGSTRVFPTNSTNDIINDVGKSGLLSLIIDEEYGGNRISTHQSSNLLTKISSVNPALGVVVMVPNSLGPGELLTHYGTQQQKDNYLPKLSDGTLIPCFGLTGPNNGSDATGSIDKGRLIEKDGKLAINVSLNKRYITLAPVASLCGIAFELTDPDNLLDKYNISGKLGVCVALVEKGHPNLRLDTHHNPLNVGFPNGTIKGDIEISLDQIIGGEEQIGNGWKMLMECLAAGRGISLPATANASSKACTYGIYSYIQHRRQFRRPLKDMEAVSNKFLDMVFNTWIIQSSIYFTNTLLDEGEKPAVISAIMKQQTTDRGREVINHAMDIYAGSAICLGNNNFVEQYYRAAPVGITVEGSNTLTKNLIIFGQGLNKSHPYIFPVYESILNDNYTQFKSSLFSMISHFITSYMSVIIPFETNLRYQTLIFANLSNFVALLGGKIKSNQSISGDMADILSNLYLGYCLKWYEMSNESSQVLTDYCINRLINENKIIINRVIENLPLMSRIMLIPSKYYLGLNKNNYQENRDVVNEIFNNHKIMEDIQENLYMNTPIFKKFEQLNMLKAEGAHRPDHPKNKEYEEIYQSMIQVGEFNNPEIVDGRINGDPNKILTDV